MRRAVVGVVLAVATSTLGCPSEERPRDDAAGGSSSATTTSVATTSTGAGGADGGDGLETPHATPPEPGWHLWPLPPHDCALFVPDDITQTIPPLDWQPCPYMPDGCSRIDAPWAATSGAGFLGLLTVHVAGDDVYLGLSRLTYPDWAEVNLYKNDQPLAAWGSSVPDGKCVLGGAELDRSGKLVIEAIRVQAETHPYVFIGAPESITTAPADILTFEPPDSALFPNGELQRSERFLVMGAHYGMFSVRDLLTGVTHHPSPPGSWGSLDARVAGSTVYIYAWKGYDVASEWTWTPEGGAVPLLQDPAYSYNRFETDGKHAAWNRGSGQTGENSFEVVELWAAALPKGPRAFVPRKLATLPINSVTDMSVGDGWVAVRVLPTDVRLYNIQDGSVRRLPADVNMGYHGTHLNGLTIAGGRVWAKTNVPWGAGNNVQFITRFEIDKLPILSP